MTIFSTNPVDDNTDRIVHMGPSYDINRSAGAISENSLIDILNQDLLDTINKKTSTGSVIADTNLLVNCCTGANKDTSQCGIYSNKSQACASLFGACKANDIKNYTNPTHKQSYCNSACLNDLATCDSIKVGFCKEHPEDPMCSCISLDESDEYKSWSNAFENVNPNTKYNKVMYLDENLKNTCKTGDDLKNVFLTSDIIKDRKKSSDGQTINDVLNPLTETDTVFKEDKSFLFLLLFIFICVVLSQYFDVIEQRGKYITKINRTV